MNSATRGTVRQNFLLRWLFQPVDSASLAVFRIAFGLAIVAEVARYFHHDWIKFFWTDRVFLFKYYGFEWVHPLPEIPMHLFMGLVGVMGACIALGLFYRAATVAFFFSFAYIFLLEQAMYLNHFYLIVLLGGILSLTPANACFSVDARRRPELRRDRIALWCVLLPAAQVAIAYFYGGLAKLDADWLQGEPMRIWLWQNSDLPLLGKYFLLPAMPYLFAWGGLLLDLLVVPGLLWKRTRAATYVIAVLFHLMNSQLFPIGIFPWLMIAATTIFFPPSWPRDLLSQIGSRFGRLQPAAPLAEPKVDDSPRRKLVIATLLILYLTIQVTVPFRHLLYPGNASWTEEGHRFAWRMKLRDKERHRITYLVREKQSGKEYRVDPGYFLSRYQKRRLAIHPDMILQFAHFLKVQFERRGRGEVEVRALAGVSLNGRRPQWIVDPEVDLAAQPRNLWPAAWITQLSEPLPPHAERFAEGIAHSEETQFD